MKKSTKNAKRKYRNIVAKFAAKFQRGRRFRDKTKYYRKNKHNNENEEAK
tara:strand:+ start:602 stop:751 length:150 start_codon:yes stop_codon:yes gene_type:complete